MYLVDINKEILPKSLFNVKNLYDTNRLYS